MAVQSSFKTKVALFSIANNSETIFFLMSLGYRGRDGCWHAFVIGNMCVQEGVL